MPDYSELDALIEEAKNDGVDPDIAAEWVDGLVDFNEILPQPFGAIAEALDGPVFSAIGKALNKLGKNIKKALEPDPVRRAKRQAKRAKKRAEAKTRREERRAKRLK